MGVAVALFHPEFRQKYCSVDTKGTAALTVNIGIVLCGGNVDVVKIAALMHELGL